MTFLRHNETEITITEHHAFFRTRSEAQVKRIEALLPDPLITKHDESEEYTTYVMPKEYVSIDGLK